jgi:hypothetical protein
MSYKYKAKNGQDFFIPGVGQSKDGIIETEETLESPALESITDSQPVEAQQVAAQGAVIGVAPQATATAPQQASVEPPVQAVAETAAPQVEQQNNTQGII